MGYLYRPKYPPEGKTYKASKADGTLRESATWWAQYSLHGRRVRESTNTAEKHEAVRFLRAREGRVAAGQPVLPRVDKIRYDEVGQDLRRFYETTGRREEKEYKKRLAHLDAHFTGRFVASLAGADATEYVARRQAGGAANGTINRELAILGRMLRLAYENGKLLRVPVIRLLKEAAPRAGFFERAQYEAVRRHLRPDLQVAVGLAYTFGWRVRDEVLTLKRSQVDLEAGTVRLEPGSTKNRDGRVVYLTPALTAELAAQLDRVRAVERATGRIIPFVFPHTAGLRIGQPLHDFRRAWVTACIRAGFFRVDRIDAKTTAKVPTKLRHDFRRTAVRNMVNDGTPERVAMQITGHKTRSVFDRYHIVAPEDLKAAAARIAARDDSPSLSPSGGGAVEMVSRKSR